MAKKVAKKDSVSSAGKKQASKAPSGRKIAVKKITVNIPAESEVKSLTIPPGSTYLTADQLREFRQLLLEKLKEITGDVSHIESGALKSSRADASGDLSSMPIHMADLGSDNYEQEFALGLMHSERQIVHEILAALKRIDLGTYGICEGTGEPIPLDRLRGIAWTRYSVRYAQSIEKARSFRGSDVSPLNRQDESADEVNEDSEET